MPNIKHPTATPHCKTKSPAPHCYTTLQCLITNTTLLHHTAYQHCHTTLIASDSQHCHQTPPYSCHTGYPPSTDTTLPTPPADTSKYWRRISGMSGVNTEGCGSGLARTNTRLSRTISRTASFASSLIGDYLYRA